MLALILNQAIAVLLSVVVTVQLVYIYRRIKVGVVSLLAVYLAAYLTCDLILTVYRAIDFSNTTNNLLDPIRAVRLLLLFLIAKLYLTNKLDSFVVINRRKEDKPVENDRRKR